MNSRKRKPRTPHGEDSLSDIESIEIVLEDGRKATFSMDAELCIPSDPDLLFAEAERAPARYAFWSYQTERALSTLRKAEAEYDRMVAGKELLWRKYYNDHTAEAPTNDMVRARVDQENDVLRAKNRLTSRKREYGILRALRDAQAHRTRMIESLCWRDRSTRVRYPKSSDDKST